MKKILLAFLIAAAPLAFLAAQESTSASSTGGNFSCSTSCFFESCWVNCTLEGNAHAVCWCWWGLAYCECKGSNGATTVSTDYGLTQTEEQRANFLAFQQKLTDRGYEQLASIAVLIQNGIERKSRVNTLITEFGKIADALPESDQKILNDYIDDVDGLK